MKQIKSNNWSPLYVLRLNRVRESSKRLICWGWLEND